MGEVGLPQGSLEKQDRGQRPEREQGGGLTAWDFPVILFMLLISYLNLSMIHWSQSAA